MCSSSEIVWTAQQIFAYIAVVNVWRVAKCKPSAIFEDWRAIYLSEIHRDMCGVYREDSMDHSNISRCFSQKFFAWVYTHCWTYEITALLSSNCTPSKSLLSLPNKKKITWGYIWISKVGEEGGPNLASWWFPRFSGSVRPLVVLKEGNQITSCFPLGLDLILYFYQQSVGIIFCNDDPAFLKEIKMDNIGWGDWCSWSTTMWHVLHSLSLFCLWKFYTIRTLKFWTDMLLQTVIGAYEEFLIVGPLLQ